MWTTGTISPVSQIVGVPLLIHREAQELSLDEPNDENKDNQAVTYLMIDLESGFAPPRFVATHPSNLPLTCRGDLNCFSLHRWQKNIGPVGFLTNLFSHEPRLLMADNLNCPFPGYYCACGPKTVDTSRFGNDMDVL